MAAHEAVQRGRAVRFDHLQHATNIRPDIDEVVVAWKGIALDACFIFPVMVWEYTSM